MIRLIQNQNEKNDSQYGCVVRVTYRVYFVKISIRDALPQSNNDARKVNV